MEIPELKPYQTTNLNIFPLLTSECLLLFAMIFYLILVTCHYNITFIVSYSHIKNFIVLAAKLTLDYAETDQNSNSKQQHPIFFRTAHNGKKLFRSTPATNHPLSFSQAKHSSTVFFSLSLSFVRLTYLRVNGTPSSDVWRHTRLPPYFLYQIISLQLLCCHLIANQLF